MPVVMRKLKKSVGERIGGNEEGEMNWKEANIEGGRKKIGGEVSVERNTWGEYISRRRNIVTSL